MTIRYYTTTPYLPELQHSLYIVSLCYEATFERSESRDGADITIGEGDGDTLCFTNALFGKLYSENPYYSTDNTTVVIDGKSDHLSSIFYLVNCLQELNPDPASRDHFGRYDAFASLQIRNKVLGQNVVAELAAKVIALFPNGSSIKKKVQRSRIFLSHDMDTIYGSLVQDTYASLKQMNIAAMGQAMLSNLLNGPNWLNVDKIMAIESESDFKSTFFWLVKKGTTERGLRNSDYDINNSKVKEAVKSISDKGWYNGLHKSIGDSALREELKALPAGIISNRYHYLYFDPFKDFQKIEEAGIKLDCSLGFASHMGFRNSFGLPVHMFDIVNRKPYDFLECPLHCMDTTYLFYQKKSGNEFVKDVIAFVERNDNNCVLSILFHNNYISEYKFKDYLKAFKQLLAYFYESAFKSITQEEILKTYA